MDAAGPAAGIRLWCLSLIHILDQLHQDIIKQFKNIKHKEFMVFHPAWKYFCVDYGLEEIAIEQDGKEPTAQEMARLIDQARQKGIRVILTSPQHSAHEAEAIASDLQAVSYTHLDVYKRQQ